MSSLFKNKKFLVGGAVIVIALGIIGFRAFASSATYYYELSEFVQKGEAVHDQTVKVKGTVAPASVEQSITGAVLEFTLTDAAGGSRLPVVYRGVVPDSFKEGNDLVCEGRLDSSGIFQAAVLMPKCPSKYEASPSAASR